MMYLENNGISDEGLSKVREYLDRVKEVDPDNPTLRKMLRRFLALIKKR